MTLQELVELGAADFRQAGVFLGHGFDDYEDEALFLALHALGLDYDVDASILSQPLTVPEQQTVRQWFLQRIDKKIPAAYLTKKTYFCGLPFYVDERVLIPRSPIAELISQRFVPWVKPEKVRRILDVCTGSACIAIACAYAFPKAQVDASDISEEALAVAGINQEKHRLSSRVQLVKSDMWAAIPKQRYDIIVSNPPYVPADDMLHLPQEYLHEPALGLQSGDDGLVAIKQLLAGAKQYLSSEGILVVEVGVSQEAVVKCFPEYPFLWLAFEHGGEGVFLLTAEQLS